MALQKTKSSAYTERYLHAIPAPLDPDSDPEFNAGTFVYEKKTKKRGRKAVNDSGSDVPLSRRISRRRGVVVQNDVKSSWMPKQRSRGRTVSVANPLLEYFGDDLDLHSASEDDEQDVEVDDDSSDKDISRVEEPVVSRTLLPFVNNQMGEAISTRSSLDRPVVDDSETESESDAEPTSRLEKRKSPPQVLPPAKRVKTPQQPDDSETESESEAGPLQASPNDGENFCAFSLSNFYPSFLADDSETETEDEADLVANPSFSPRPGFPLVPGQVPLGPLVLDRTKRIMVPAAINTDLREYQRDGVRFFWELYDQERGGLLGDDMGLGELLGTRLYS
ncbi:hypothetical protein EDC04DRAFT_2892075 [Pisolithus marmoratus]|nr:hypothetical protein EDC04DRAFT_2892075 [Pisolithus marmoratus]